MKLKLHRNAHSCQRRGLLRLFMERVLNGTFFYEPEEREHETFSDDFIF